MGIKKWQVDRALIMQNRTDNLGWEKDWLCKQPCVHRRESLTQTQVIWHWQIPTHSSIGIPDRPTTDALCHLYIAPTKIRPFYWLVSATQYENKMKNGKWEKGLMTLEVGRPFLTLSRPGFRISHKLSISTLAAFCPKQAKESWWSNILFICNDWL